VILLYASPHEIKYVDYKPKYCIGVGGQEMFNSTFNFNNLFINFRQLISMTDRVILFGSSGLTNRYDCCITDWDLHKWKYDEFIIPTSWNGIKVNGKCCAGYTSNHAVKEKWEADWLYSKQVSVVDQESYHVAKVCRDLGIKFTSVRYITDICYKKCMPIGINWAWRMYQHRRMQLKFNKYLEEL